MRTYPILLAFLVMGFGDVVGTLVGFAKETFNLSASSAGLLPFLGFIMFGILSVPVGVLQDIKGRKFTLILGLSIALVGLIIPVVNTSQYFYLVVSILLLGAGMVILQVSGNPIMRDVSAPGKYSRNLSFAQFIKSIGSLSGSLLAVFVLASWQGLFPIYSVIVGFTLFTVALMKINELKDEKKEERASLISSFKMLKNWYVLVMVIAIFLYVGAEVGINSWIASLLNSRYGLDLKSMATLGISFFFGALMIGRFLGAIILTWIQPKIFLFSTTIISSLSILLLFIPNKILSLAAIFIIGLGFANIFPLIFSILIDHIPNKSNELSGLMVMAIVGGAIMPFLMGFIADHSLMLSFLVPLISLIFIVFAALISFKAKGAEA
ncbi:MAG: MFS transporter [Acidobacteria bacterium]|nr:MFS transporter [Acidobacteriota bacterium]